MWLWVGQGTMFCFQSQGRRPPRQIAYSSLFSILLFSVRPPDLLPPLGVKEGDRGGDTQLGHWELGRSSLPIHAFIYRAFTECGTWHDPCIHVGDRRYTVMGL